MDRQRKKSLKIILVFICLLLLMGYGGHFVYAEVGDLADLKKDTPRMREGKKHILVLHSYHEGLPWVDSINAGIFSVLRTEKNLELHLEYMDTKRYIDQADLDRFETYFQEKYRFSHFDEILVSDDAAYQFMLKKQREMFPQTPIVFCGVNRFSEREIKENGWVTGVVETVDVKSTVEAAIRIHPKAKKVVVINDRTVVGEANRILLDMVKGQMPHIQFILWDNMTMQEVQEAVGKLDETHVILMMTFNVDRDKVIYSYEESLELIAPKSKAPIYAIWDFYLGHGLVGGMLTSGYSQGERAAQMALRILREGEKPADIPVVINGVNQFIFDYGEMEKWNISEGQLPAGSRIVNKPISFYETYKTLVWSVSTAFCLLLVFLGILVTNIRRRKQSELEVRQLNEQLEVRVQNRTRELQNVNQKLVSTLTELKNARQHLIEAEKMASLGELVAGVAHEINTPVGNGITAASHLEGQVGILREKILQGTIKKSEILSFLELCERVSKSILTNLQRGAELVQSFKQVAVDQMIEDRRKFNLCEYLQEVLLSLRPQLKKTKIKVAFTCSEELQVSGYPGALWQIVSNLVMNSLIHAYEPGDEGTISIDISRQDSGILFEYSDDGKGMTEEVRKKIFEPFFTTKRGGGGTGLGMHIVYNLVVFKLQGTIECNSRLGSGTCFTISFPETLPLKE